MSMFMFMNFAIYIYGKYTRMLSTVLKKTWKQRPTKRQLYSHLLPISQTIQVRETRYIWLCWGSRDEFISKILLKVSTHGHISVGRPAKTYSSTLFGPWMPSRGPAKSDEWYGLKARGHWRNPYCLHGLTMIYKYIFKIKNKRNYSLVIWFCYLIKKNILKARVQ